MDSIFIVPVGGKAGYTGRTTKLEGELLSTLALPTAVVETVKNASIDGCSYVTGIVQTVENQAVWEQMSAEDLLLYYVDGTIVAAANLVARVYCPEAAERLWSHEASRSLLCFTDELYTGEVPIIPPMHRYLSEEYGGLTKLDNKRVRYILSDYGSFKVFTQLCLRYDFPFSLRHT